jgi:putative transposase
MARTYTNLLYHIIFSTKNRRPWIHPQIRQRLYQYCGGIVSGLGGVGLQIGGVEDHLHALASLPPTLTVADFIGKLKANSSIWMKDFSPVFAWQAGYAAFTVSKSQVLTVRQYIVNQEAHHKKFSFEEEWDKLLKAHGIPTD